MSRFLHSTSKKRLLSCQAEKEKSAAETIKATVKQHITQIQYPKHSDIPAVNNKSLKVNNLSKYLKLQEKD